MLGPVHPADLLILLAAYLVDVVGELSCGGEEVGSDGERGTREGGEGGRGGGGGKGACAAVGAPSGPADPAGCTLI